MTGACATQSNKLLLFPAVSVGGSSSTQRGLELVFSSARSPSTDAAWLWFPEKLAVQTSTPTTVVGQQSMMVAESGGCKLCLLVSHPSYTWPLLANERG